MTGYGRPDNGAAAGSCIGLAALGGLLASFAAIYFASRFGAVGVAGFSLCYAIAGFFLMESRLAEAGTPFAAEDRPLRLFAALAAGAVGGFVGMFVLFFVLWWLGAILGIFIGIWLGVLASFWLPPRPPVVLIGGFITGAALSYVFTETQIDFGDMLLCGLAGAAGFGLHLAGIACLKARRGLQKHSTAETWFLYLVVLMAVGSVYAAFTAQTAAQEQERRKWETPPSLQDPS